jgi:hypothetical protein
MVAGEWNSLLKAFPFIVSILASIPLQVRIRILVTLASGETNIDSILDHLLWISI